MDTATETDPEVLRADMVERILAKQHLPPTVLAALRSVERHRFVPNTSIHDAYADAAVITHTAPDGTSLSCASEPAIVAAMLTALDVQPDHNVLEVGAGTGYNAALLAALVGPNGTVTTVDIDPDVTAGANRHLNDTGFDHVTVITRDGALGAPEHGPYDRIIFTVGAWDIPQAIWDQMVPGGRLVVPLRWRGTTRAIAFIKQHDHWASDWVFLCGFVPMLGQPGEHSATIDPDKLVTLHYDADQPIDTAALQGVLNREKSVLWSDATVHGQEPFDRIWVRLSAVDDGTVRIQADPQAVTSGLCTPAIPIRTPAIAEHESLAYLTIRRLETIPGRWQLGATGHGPAGQQLAQRIIDQIIAWDQDRIGDPAVLAYPTSGPTPQPSAGKAIEKPNIRLLLRY